MGALAFCGLPIAALGLPMGAKAGGFPASASAIRLPAIAATADTKTNVAKTACHANQKHNPALAKSQKPRYYKIAAATFRSRTEGYFQKPEMSVSGFSLSSKNTPELSRFKQVTQSFGKTLGGLPMSMRGEHGQPIMNRARVSTLDMACGGSQGGGVAGSAGYLIIALHYFVTTSFRSVTLFVSYHGSFLENSAFLSGP